MPGLDKSDEKEMLRAEADAMRKALKTIERRIADLEKEISEYLRVRGTG